MGVTAVGRGASWAPGRSFSVTTAVALALSIAFRTLAFVFAKYAALASAGGSLAGIVANPWYWAELAAFGAQSVFWVVVLRTTPLSVAYPAMALVYALNLTWAWYLFGETVTTVHVLGCAMMIAGIVVATARAAESTS